jgi:uncharacterized membrane-anchored protein YjiN (DUF445 family)
MLGLIGRLGLGVMTPTGNEEFSSLSDFLLLHKGDVTLAVSALAYVISWLIVRFTTWNLAGELGVSISEAALVGGLCDYIALKMIFERRWYLPNSGVLPRNRQRLIDGIASTIENEWLTPRMIGQRLNQMHLVDRLGSFLEEVELNHLLGREGLDQILSRLLDYLESPKSHEQFELILRRALPKTFERIYAIANRMGVESLSTRAITSLRRRLPELRNDPELIEAIETAIHEFGRQLHDSSSYAHQLAGRLLDAIVERAVDASRGQISQMVRDNLALLSDDQIRFQIETKTRHHLDWIRVNGGIFGAIFGLLFALSRIIMREGPAWMAHLHMLG